ncbi:MAG: flavin-dependent oxidoreductase [Alphaproteobacteria bacterium]|nr:flavin-dependent oxidoreductase [Alphaproteobacteria bacterium]MCW5739199.1 flavin-dependent oxidoreductase [Alphaproteobacteria bacterium]
MHDVLIIGGGIAGLTTALSLHEAGIRCRVFEAAPSIEPIGVGINVLPHASAILARLGLEPALAAVAVQTTESAFFNRFGQLIYREPLGRAAGYAHPQFSIHRGDLQRVLHEAVRARLGDIALDRRCMAVETGDTGVVARFADGSSASGSLAIACDGIHSLVRKQLYPHEGAPRYAGVNMWRGVTRWRPFLSGATMVRAGWLACGKMVIYPIREQIDAEGRQLVNWVAEIETPADTSRDWNRGGRLEDFLWAFADWHFDWLDVPAFLRAADVVLEFPMVDQDPLPAWSFGRLTLLGDAAHPMVPRGSNGAGQAILDADAIARCLRQHADPVAALKAYEAARLGPTTDVVLTNRKNPPDAILREVFVRSGDKPFARIEDVISPAELAAISDSYKRVAQYDKATLAGR